MLAVAGRAHAAQYGRAVDPQRVGSRSGQVDALDAPEPPGRQRRRQVENERRAVERQRVRATAAIGHPEGEIADDQPVVARAALEHVRAAATRQNIGERATDQDLGRRRAVRYHRAAERAAEHDVARPGIAAVGIGIGRTDDQVVIAVAVHVARRGDGPAATIEGRDTGQAETRRALEVFEVDVRGEARRLAEHHVARAGARAVGVRIAGADDQVVVAVAVHVARRSDRPTGQVTRQGAAQLETRRAVQRRKIDVGREATRLAEHHVARAGIAAGPIDIRGADDQVVVTVAVHVARGGD